MWAWELMWVLWTAALVEVQPQLETNEDFRKRLQQIPNHQKFVSILRK
jgi:hypothetical protein